MENERVDLRFNTIGSAKATEDLKRLIFSRQLAFIEVALTYRILNFSLSPSIYEVALGTAHSSGFIQVRKNLAFMARELMQRVEKGTLNPRVKEVFPREELPADLKKFKGRHIREKMIVRMQT